MNKRQKKKAYKKIMGTNPPAEVRFCGNHYRNIMHWGAFKAKRQQEIIRNLEGFTKTMTERRRTCRKRNW